MSASHDFWKLILPTGPLAIGGRLIRGYDRVIAAGNYQTVSAAALAYGNAHPHARLAICRIDGSDEFFL